MSEQYPVMSGDAEALARDMGGVQRTKRNVTAKAGDDPATEQPKRVAIILEESDDFPPTGLYVGHNGVGYLLRAGERIEVPIGVKEILDNAIMQMPVRDPQTQQVIGWRSRTRYSYRLA